MNTFSIGEALGFGWKTTKANFWFFAGVAVIMVAVSFVSNLLVKGLHLEKTLGETIVNILFWVVMAFLQMGIIRVAIKLVDGQSVSYNDIFSYNNIFPQFLISVLLSGLLTCLGLVVFVVPGVIIALGLRFSQYFVVDKNLAGIEALKASWNMTKGQLWQLLGLAFVAMLINIIGVIAFFVGLLFTAPTTLVAYAYVYRKLSGTLLEPAEDLPVVATPILPVVPEHKPV